jgi:serine/threonine-protein kinase
MPLTAGAHLGPYEIVRAIGAGGMGEIWRARDTRLDRDVAIKVLPEAFAGDPERVARFEREAKTLAALNHPHIAIIHGLEHVAPVTSGAAPALALVMELVEGEDLSERVASGPIRLDEALPLARQIAEALEAAHAHGVIHRDLKPANIKVRRDGEVKVLDFGLAKLAEPSGSGGSGRSGGGGLSQSPTITSPAAMTGVGVLLGTAAYMAPEQVRGKPVDKRADIWAFGCVLYEMLTGKRAFQAEAVSLTLAEVMKSDPEWSRLPPGTPALLTRLLRRCLQKDPGRRLHDIADARLELEDLIAGASAEDLPARGQNRRSTVGIAWILAGLSVAGLVYALLFGGEEAGPPAGVTRFTVELLPGQRLNGPMALSRDGRTLVYGAQSPAASNQLYIRRAEDLAARAMPDTDGARFPFMSPDGQSIGFIVNGTTIKTMPLSGRASVTVASVSAGFGAAWLADDTIIFGSARSGLMRVSVTGGEPQPLTELDASQGEVGHISPVPIPGTDGVLFTVRSRAESSSDRIEVLSLSTRVRRTLTAGSAASVLPDGRIVFERDGSLWSAPFDLEQQTLTAPATSVISGLGTRSDPGRVTAYAIGAGGSLAYQLAESEGYELRKLVWVDRRGNEQPINAPARAWWWPTISPDGKRLGVHIMNSANMDAWIYALDRGPLMRLTDNPGVDGYPLWTPDGTRVVFWSNRGNTENLFWRAADFSGEDNRLTENIDRRYPFSWAAGGTLLVYSESSPDTKQDIGVVPVADGTRTGRLIIHGPADETRPSMSSDGRWIAYQSNKSGQWEVYVQRFPELDALQQISLSGGESPLWSPDGRELFFRKADAVLRVPIEASSSMLTHENPEVLFKGPYVPESGGPSGRSYALAPDGQRFLMMKGEGRLDTDGGAAQIVWVQNWSSELTRASAGR